jgi:hypothetical protein
MINKPDHHTFHIPVMGIGYTIDTPIRVAHLGISSSISLVDDSLIEIMREFYCSKFEIPFTAISNKIKDFRAKRITEYLNLVDHIVKEKFEKLKNSASETGSDIEKYMELLPDFSALKEKLRNLIQNAPGPAELTDWIKENLKTGDVDVNIMTKLDKENFIGDEKLPVEFNDAHAALRGFANSNLSSSVILSAGMNPRLYSYIENFDDFYPDENGQINKKIILKISDYRSAIIQGKFLAKKGLWISEFRVESGLNCGGHAFASDGYLMGPILDELKEKREILTDTIFEIYAQALKDKNRPVPYQKPSVKITAQGGVGTASEHQLLLNYYNLDSVGWGTPFLLSPEVVSIDNQTLDLLIKAEEKDLYLSNISPLGVPFNSVRNNTKDIEKELNISKGKPGSSCPKHLLSFNTEFGEKPICTASRNFQSKKIAELNNGNHNAEAYDKLYKLITDKSCICVGLGTATLLVNNLSTQVEGTGVSVCPGPNMAYFTEIVSLKQMTDHIYGRINLIKRKDRPNIFLKELGLYIDYLRNLMLNPVPGQTEKYLQNFAQNLHNGISYYKNFLTSLKDDYQTAMAGFSIRLEEYEAELDQLANTYSVAK